MSEATKEISESMKNADQTKAQTVLMYNNLISQSMIIGQTLVEDYVTLLKNPNVSRKVKEMLSHYSDSYTLDFEMSRKSCIIEVRARSQSAELAAQAVNATMSVFQEEQERLMGVRFMSPIQYASVPQNPYFPKLKILLGLGIFFGGFAGFALAILADLIDFSFKRPEDVEQVGQLCLGTVSHMHTLKDRMDQV